MASKKLIYFFLISLLLVQCSATPKKRSFGEIVDDNVVAMKLHSKFVKDKTVKDSLIKIKVWKGTVKLTGSVETQDQINRAIEIAEQQAGVKEVKAYLVLKDMQGVTIKEDKSKKAFWNILPQKNRVKETGNEANSVVVTDLTDTKNKKELSDQTTQTTTQNKTATKSNPDQQSKNSNDDSDFQEIQY